MDTEEIYSKYRGGRYDPQEGGYKVFIPAQLPPNPPVQLEGALRVLLSQAEMAIGRLEGSIQVLPDADLFTKMLMRKDIIVSNQMEGNKDSLSDLLAQEAEISSLVLENPYDAINYLEALNYGLEHLREKPLYTQLIKEIYKRLFRTHHRSDDTRELGEFRKIQNWIGRPGDSLENAYFVPPPPNRVLAALTNLEKFVSDSSELPPLIRVGVAYAQFEMILPFLSGNGQIGRILIILLMRQQKILNEPILGLSLFFRQHRGEFDYYIKLIRDGGEWESWLSFFLRVVIDASTETTETIRRILVLRETHRSVLAQKMGRAVADGNRVLEYLFQNPFVRVEDVREITGTSYVAANNLLKRLLDPKIGILSEVTKNKRNRIFRYDSYLQILNERTGMHTLQENREEDQL